MKINFSQIMAGMARRYRDNTCIMNVERNRRFTFSQYHLLSNRVANVCLRDLQLQRGDTAMVILNNDNLSLVYLAAIFKQAATFAFCNQRDSEAEHRLQIEHINAKVVFIEASMLSTYQSFMADYGCTVVVMDHPDHLPAGVKCFWDLIDAASDEEPNIEIDSHNDIVLLRFTGGTTGRGKCAPYSFDKLMATRDNALLFDDFRWNEATRQLIMTPLSHAPIMVVLPALFTGGATYTMNSVDLDLWSTTVMRECITHGLFVPTLLYRLLEYIEPRSFDLSSLTTMMYGASTIAPSALERLIAYFGPIFLQAYGATESFTFISILDKKDHLIVDALGHKRLGSAGRIAPDQEIKIVADDGSTLASDEIGEVWVRSRGTIDGYYRNPEETAAEFVDGFWRSGDMGYIDQNGYLFLVDRRKDMIISGGFNIYAAEVEAALLTHPAVLMSAVVGVPHPQWGEAVHAEVVFRAGMTASEESLINQTKSILGGYKVPRSVRIVDQLPMSPAGKVLRRLVRNHYRQP